MAASSSRFNATYLLMVTSLSRRLLLFSSGLFIGLVLSQPCYSQSKESSTPTTNRYAAFEELLHRLPEKWHGDSLLAPPVIFRDSVYGGANLRKRRLQFEVRLAEHPLQLRRQAVSLRNPFGGAAWPLSYSVIYQHCLVALFSPGKFACYRLTDLSRNQPLEQQLNSQRFEQHWVMNKQLVGWRSGRTYAYDTTRQAWRSATLPLPFDKQTKIFEDERFACSTVCAGEFGGLLYFYDKQTRRTHYVDATCGTSVWKQDGQYRVLASLAHMSGSASSAVIPRPEMLPVVATPRIAVQDWQYNFANSISNPAVQRIFAYYGVTMLGGLRWRNQTLYLVNWRNATFLASIANEQINIVDPLFNNSLTHTGLTTGYGSSLSLTSLLIYKRQEYEAACILIDGDQVTKIEWNN